MTLWIIIPPGQGGSLYYSKSRQGAMEFVYELGGPPPSQWTRPAGLTGTWQAGEWQIRTAITGD